VLLAAVLALASAAIAAGAFSLASTSWFAGAPTANSGAQPPAAAKPPVAAPGAPAPGNNQGSVSQQPATLDTTQVNPPPGGDSAGTLPYGAEELKQQGIAAFNAQDYSTAVDRLQASVTIDGGDAVTYYQLGLAYMAVQGREHALDDAELAFRSAASLQPEWAAPQRLMAESLLRRGYAAEAIAPALKATQLAPGEADAWFTLGNVYKAAGRDSEAAAAYAEATRLAPLPPPAP
jgi:tetratricopeptide (TPR) repeat protein